MASPTYQSFAPLVGAGIGTFFGGPVGGSIGNSLGQLVAGFGGGAKKPNAERFASGITALACLRAPSSAACQGPRNLFTSDYWRRRYPDSARKWQSFYSTGRAPWTEQWIRQAIGYQAQRYGISAQMGLQLGQQRLGASGGSYGGGTQMLRFQ